MGHIFTRVASLDLSLNHIGHAEYCCVSGRLVYDLCEPFRSKKGDEMHYDLERFTYNLKFVKARVDSSTLVIVEDFAFARPNQAHQLGGLGYLIRFWLWQNKIPFLLVGTGELKKFVSGKGNSPKDVMIKDIYRVFGLDVNDNNLADAIGLNFVGRALLHEYDPKYAHQRDIVENLKKKFWAVLSPHFSN